MIYSYEAKDGGGRTITGSLDALDERTAARQVRDMGYFLMRLAPSSPSSDAGIPSIRVQHGGDAAVLHAPASLAELGVGGRTPGAFVRVLRSFWPGVSLRDLALFYRQFAALINAGVPIYQCLTTLGNQVGSPGLRHALREIGNSVQAGGSLGAAMAQFPWIFSDFHRAMVAAGEMTGRLDLMFARIAEALEQEYALRNNIIRETWYPAMVFVFSFLLQPNAMVELVVHQNILGYARMALPPLLECIFVAAAVVVLTKVGSQFKYTYDAIIAHLPAIGGAVRMIALARFARALALLYGAGDAVPNAVRTAAAASGNAYLGRKMVRAIPAMEAGEGIAASLAETGAFPPMVVTMLSVGEQTGDLDQTMTKVAEFFEQESAVRLHQLSVTLGAAVTILIGIKVGLFVIHFYTGYFNTVLNTDAN
jgi:type IV pilus assembly protein PilC